MYFPSTRNLRSAVSGLSNSLFSDSATVRWSSGSRRATQGFQVHPQTAGHEGKETLLSGHFGDADFPEQLTSYTRLLPLNTDSHL